MVNWTWERDGKTAKLQGFTLERGQHRPVITEVGGIYYATAISGYTRKFSNLLEAKEFAGRVPVANVAKLLTEDHWQYIRKLVAHEFECNESADAAAILAILNTDAKE